MANEFDFLEAKKMEDWDHYIRFFAENDPYQRLRGIHNGVKWYDHTNPLITHASIQNENTYKAKEYRMKCKKPVVFDECRYEGNIPWTWGNLTPEEMVNKIWLWITNGGYAGPGDTYVTEQPLQWPEKSSDVLWWSKGGTMKGKSQDRIKFLKGILESAPGNLSPPAILADFDVNNIVTYKNEYFLAYLNRDQSRYIVLDLPENVNYSIEVIDAWNMTITPLDGIYSGKCMVELPQKQMTALRIMKIK